MTEQAYLQKDEFGFNGKPGYNYVVVPVEGMLIGMDDNYFDVDAGVANSFSQLKIKNNIFSHRGKIRTVVKLADLLGLKEEYSEKSRVMHLREKQIGLDFPISLLVYKDGMITTLADEQIKDTYILHEELSKEFGGFETPKFAKKVGYSDEGYLFIVDLRELVRDYFKSQ